MPLFNKEQSLRRAIDSVLAQSHKEYEIIIVNDGSTDNSANIVKTYSDRRIRLYSKDNEGPATARNYGIKKAVNEYLCFLDCDDAWNKDFLKLMDDSISAYPDAGIYTAKYCEIDENGNLISYNTNTKSGYVDNFFQKYLTRGILNSSSLCCKKSALLDVDLFPSGVRIGEDIYTWLRIADFYRVVYIDIEAVNTYRNSENRSSEINSAIMPYHIQKISQSQASEFSAENREQVLLYVKKSALIFVSGYALSNNLPLAREVIKLIKNISLLYSVLALTISVVPRPVLLWLKNYRNANSN